MLFRGDFGLVFTKMESASMVDNHADGPGYNWRDGFRSKCKSNDKHHERGYWLDDSLCRDIASEMVKFAVTCYSSTLKYWWGLFFKNNLLMVLSNHNLCNWLTWKWYRMPYIQHGNVDGNYFQSEPKLLGPCWRQKHKNGFSGYAISRKWSAKLDSLKLAAISG